MNVINIIIIVFIILYLQNKKVFSFGMSNVAKLAISGSSGLAIIGIVVAILFATGVIGGTGINLEKKYGKGSKGLENYRDDIIEQSKSAPLSVSGMKEYCKTVKGKCSNDTCDVCTFNPISPEGDSQCSQKTNCPVDCLTWNGATSNATSDTCPYVAEAMEGSVLCNCELKRNKEDGKDCLQYVVGSECKSWIGSATSLPADFNTTHPDGSYLGVANPHDTKNNGCCPPNWSIAGGTIPTECKAGDPKGTIYDLSDNSDLPREPNTDVANVVPCTQSANTHNITPSLPWNCSNDGSVCPGYN